MNGDEQPRRDSWLYAPLGTAFFLALAIASLLIVGLVALDACLRLPPHRIISSFSSPHPRACDCQEPSPAMRRKGRQPPLNRPALYAALAEHWSYLQE